MEGQVGAAGVIAFATLAAPVVKQIINRIRSWVPALEGGWIQVLAIVMGVVVAWLFSVQVVTAVNELVAAAGGEGFTLRNVPLFVEYIAAGIYIALVAGYLHDKEVAVATGGSEGAQLSGER